MGTFTFCWNHNTEKKRMWGTIDTETELNDTIDIYNNGRHVDLVIIDDDFIGYDLMNEDGKWSTGQLDLYNMNGLMN